MSGAENTSDDAESVSGRASDEQSVSGHVSVNASVTDGELRVSDDEERVSDDVERVCDDVENANDGENVIDGANVNANDGDGDENENENDESENHHTVIENVSGDEKPEHRGETQGIANASGDVASIASGDE